MVCSHSTHSATVSRSSRRFPASSLHLIPALVLLALVGASWRLEWIGGLAFIGLAIFYAVMANGHIEWMLVISGPLAVVGALFWWSWFRHSELRVS